MDSFWQDMRSGLRFLVRKPGFSSTAILTLALGIGANTAIFSVVSAVLLHPLPFDDADRLVYVQETARRESVVSRPVSYANFLDSRVRSSC